LIKVTRIPTRTLWQLISCAVRMCGCPQWGTDQVAAGTGTAPEVWPGGSAQQRCDQRDQQRLKVGVQGRHSGSAASRPWRCGSDSIQKMQAHRFPIGRLLRVRCADFPTNEPSRKPTSASQLGAGSPYSGASRQTPAPGAAISDQATQRHHDRPGFMGGKTSRAWLLRRISFFSRRHGPPVPGPWLTRGLDPQRTIPSFGGVDRDPTHRAVQ
jgi:hypothetical protein